ncbi:MAG: hypothetical protein R3F31_18085 [Verrucomicrobiales bacterium]
MSPGKPDGGGIDGGDLPVGSTIVLIANDGTDAVTGTFTGLLEGATVVDDDGGADVISYVGGTGNDVVLFSGTPDTNIDLTGASYGV